MTRIEMSGLIALVAIALAGAAVWAWAAWPVDSHTITPPAWPQVTRTMLTTQAGDAYLTTAVVHPEDLDR